VGWNTLQCVLNSDRELTLESLCRPVLASSAGERPNAICMTFFPARNILRQKKLQQPAIKHVWAKTVAW